MPKQGSAVTDKMFGGGCGGGANVKPAGFLVVSGGNIRYLPVSGSSTAVDKLIDLMPEMLDKVNRTVSEFRSKKQEKREKRQQEKESIEIID